MQKGKMSKRLEKLISRYVMEDSVLQYIGLFKIGFLGIFWKN